MLVYFLELILLLVTGFLLLVDVFVLDVLLLVVVLPFFFSPSVLAIPIAWPLATLSKNLLSFNLAASSFLSIKRFSGKMAGIFVSRSTAKFAFFFPRSVSFICLLASACTVFCILPVDDVLLTLL